MCFEVIVRRVGRMMPVTFLRVVHENVDRRTRHRPIDSPRCHRVRHHKPPATPAPRSMTSAAQRIGVDWVRPARHAAPSRNAIATPRPMPAATGDDGDAPSSMPMSVPFVSRSTAVELSRVVSAQSGVRSTTRVSEGAPSSTHGAKRIAADVAISYGFIREVGRDVGAAEHHRCDGFVAARFSMSHALRPQSRGPLVPPTLGHGVTTAIMGNWGCFAPSSPTSRVVISLMEGSRHSRTFLGAAWWGWETTVRTSTYSIAVPAIDVRRHGHARATRATDGERRPITETYRPTRDRSRHSSSRKRSKTGRSVLDVALTQPQTSRGEPTHLTPGGGLPVVRWLRRSGRGPHRDRRRLRRQRLSANSHCSVCSQGARRPVSRRYPRNIINRNATSDCSSSCPCERGRLESRARYHPVRRYDRAHNRLHPFFATPTYPSVATLRWSKVGGLLDSDYRAAILSKRVPSQLPPDLR